MDSGPSHAIYDVLQKHIHVFYSWPVDVAVVPSSSRKHCVFPLDVCFFFFVQIRLNSHSNMSRCSFTQTNRFQKRSCCHLFNNLKEAALSVASAHFLPALVLAIFRHFRKTTKAWARDIKLNQMKMF